MAKMRPNAMKRRAAPVIAALALAVTMLTATPASATYLVSEIAFPNGSTTFFSPFSGPADVTFSFNDYLDPGTNDPSRTFNLRLRLQGSSSSIHTENVTITPGSQTSPRTVHFSWPAESVTTSTTYEVAVYNGGTLMRRRTFTLKPHLVRITSIKPSPFFPRVVNGYRDTTNVTYRLEASSNPVVIDIFKADAGGGCCGTQVRHTVLSNVVLGTRHFIWNGTNDSDMKVAVGRYFVRITATAFTGQTQSSSNTQVRVALYRRVLKSVSQNGNAFNRKGATARLRAGGSCSVARDNAHRDAVVSCHDAAVKVFWRWTLPASAKNKKVSFALIGVPGYTCRATKGMTGSDSWLRSGGLGQSRCRVDKAKLSYTYLKPS
jgi:hypothetical protein